MSGWFKVYNAGRIRRVEVEMKPNKDQRTLVKDTSREAKKRSYTKVRVTLVTLFVAEEQSKRPKNFIQSCLFW